MKRSGKAELWEAVNDYAAACGGDTGDGTIGGSRMDAVVAVERAVDAIVLDRLEAAAWVAAVDLETLEQEVDVRAMTALVRKLLAREAAGLVPENVRARVVYALEVGSRALIEAADANVVVPQGWEVCGDPKCTEEHAMPDPRPDWSRQAERLRVMAEELRALKAPAAVAVLGGLVSGAPAGDLAGLAAREAVGARRDDK